MVRRRPLSPSQYLTLSFLGIIAVGGALLALPFAAADGRHVGVIDAFFMSVSAVCVTGLAAVDVATELSMFGKVVLLLLIQAGGSAT